MDLPILWICYGMQLLALDSDGRVEGGHDREYGPALSAPVLYATQSPVLMRQLAEG